MDTFKVRLNGRDLQGVKVRLTPVRARKDAIWKLHDMLAPECAAQGNQIKVDRVKVVEVCAKQTMVVLVSA